MIVTTTTGSQLPQVTVAVKAPSVRLKCHEYGSFVGKSYRFERKYDTSMINIAAQAEIEASVTEIENELNAAMIPVNSKVRAVTALSTCSFFCFLICLIVATVVGRIVPVVGFIFYIGVAIAVVLLIGVVILAVIANQHAAQKVPLVFEQATRRQNAKYQGRPGGHLVWVPKTKRKVYKKHTHHNRNSSGHRSKGAVFKYRIKIEIWPTGFVIAGGAPAPAPAPAPMAPPMMMMMMTPQPPQYTAPPPQQQPYYSAPPAEMMHLQMDMQLQPQPWQIGGYYPQPQQQGYPQQRQQQQQQQQQIQPQPQYSAMPQEEFDSTLPQASSSSASSSSSLAPPRENRTPIAN